MDPKELAAAIAQALAHELGKAKEGSTPGITLPPIVTDLVNGMWAQRMWRPLAMMLWGVSWPAQLWGIFQVASTPELAASLPSLITALAAWNAPPATLAGIYSWGRTQEKIAVSKNGAGPPQ